jgi:hypothetical protein
MVATIANPSPAQVIGRASECMRRLMEAGLTYDALQQPIDDPKMRERLVGFWLSGGFQPTTSQEMARQVMSRSFFGVEEAIRHFKVRPSKKDLETLDQIPFTQEELQQVKDTHLLVAVFPFSLLQIREKAENLFYKQDWYNSQAFAKEQGKTEWVLVRRDIVANSTSKAWSDQQKLLAENEEVPLVRVMAYAIIGHCLATGERLFPSVYARCQDLSSGGRRVFLGFFDSDGLCVFRYPDDDTDGFLGLASARKVRSF